MKTLAAAALLLGISLNTLTALISSNTSNSSFGVMNQIQLIIVLPLLGSYVPVKVIDLIRAMNTSIFSFDFIHFEETELAEYISGIFSFYQPNAYLFLLELKSGSAIVNFMNLFVFVVIVVLIHLTLCAIYVLVRYTAKFKMIADFLKKSLSMMTLGVYIVMATETILILLIITLSEISIHDTSTAQQKVSLKMTYFLCSLLFIFVALVFWQFLKASKPERLAKMKYFKVMFD
jgi:hypothetical protein